MCANPGDALACDRNHPEREGVLNSLNCFTEEKDGLPTPRSLMWATEFKGSTQTQPSCLHTRVQDPESLKSSSLKLCLDVWGLQLAFKDLKQGLWM